MVVIEPAACKGEETRCVNMKPGPSGTTNTAAVDSIDDNATVGGYASDGFETASESEINDNDEDCGGNNNKSDSAQHEQREKSQKQHQEQPVPPTDHCYEDTLNDDELKEKTLEQANVAKLEGNKLFGGGLYEEALPQYELALQLAPDMPSFAEIRSICHANRAACFFKLGKYEDTIKECTKSLELNPTYMKALLRRGEAHEKLEHYEEALADMKKILELDPLHYQARRAIARLEPLAREKREKMQEEMIGKLKEMGNSILGRFGMSTDNFKAVKDPNTGSYSISFQR